MEKNPTKTYIIKGAHFRRGVTAIHVAPEVDAITDCDALRTAEETEKERVVTMSTVSVAGVTLLPTLR